MPITPSKTWEYVINLVASEVDLATRNRRLTLLLKQALTDTGSVQAVDADGANINLTTPWAVVASSNGSTASAADNWAAIADIVYANAGVAHSWIHLRQVDFFGAGDHLHMLLDCIPNTAGSPIARLSWTRGATGYNNDGTTTNRPTHAEATAEVLTRDGAATAGDEEASDMMWGSDAANAQAVLHVRISDDGLAGAVFVCIGGQNTACHGWQYHEEVDASISHPFEVWSISSDLAQEVLNWTNSLSTLALFKSLSNAGAAIASFATQPVYSTSSPASAANVSTARMIMPSFIVNTGSSTVRTVWTDLWWGNALDTTGDGSPPGTITRRQVGQMVIPWPTNVAMTVT
jgi:hypothetical protein